MQTTGSPMQSTGSLMPDSLVGDMDPRMDREKDIGEIFATLPLAKASLAPLRAVREEENDEPLPPIEFPVAAFSTKAIPRRDAWALWRELRREPRLEGLAAVVTTSEAGVLDAFWEDACREAAEKLSLRSSTAGFVPSPLALSARAWLGRKGARPLEVKGSRSARGREGAAEFEWCLSQRWPLEANDTCTVYLLDVEPWAAPLALSWLFTAKWWAEVVPLLRRWHEAHGFEVVALGCDMLEAWVARAPASPDDIAERLVETVTFCGDYLDEGFAPRLKMVTKQAWQFRFDI